MRQLYILFFMLSMALLSCKENQLPDHSTKHVRLNPPDSVFASAAKITSIDTCSKPYETFLSEKGQSIRDVTGGGSVPAHVNPIQGGAYGGLAYIQNFNTEQGLALSGISCSFTDRAGNLWFGTYGGGVSKYDGKSFTNYNTANGLAGNVVTSILQDRNGDYWIGTNGRGLSRFNGKYFKNYTTSQGLCNNKVLGIAEDATGNIWCATDGGVSKYIQALDKGDGNSAFVNFKTQDGLIANNLSCVVADKNGNVWFGSEHGIVRYNPETKSEQGSSFTKYTQTEGLLSNKVRCMLVDKAGNVWAGAGGGINKFSNENEKGQGKFSTAYKFKDGGSVISITEDLHGALWISRGDDGILKYDPKSKSEIPLTYFDAKQGFSNKVIYTGTLDKRGNLWFGTYGNGIIKYEGESVSSFTRDQGLLFDKVWCITEDKNKNLLFGTSSGLSMYDEKFFINYSKLWKTSNTIRGIVMTQNGNVWFASGGGGITKYDGNTFLTYTTEQGMPNNSTLCIAEDKKGNIWCGTYGHGITMFDGKSFTNYTTEQGLANNVVKCIAKDSKDNIWIGTNGGGVSKYDGKYFINYTVEQGLPDNTVYDIVEDHAGNIWFATAGGGACKFDGTSFTTYTVADGLADNVVYALEEDEANNIMWFGTNLGLSALHFNTITSDKIWFENFNNTTGYPIKDINTSSMYLDNKGVLWAGTGDKLIRFDYKEVQRNEELPVGFIQSLKVQSQKIAWNSLHFSVKENDLKQRSVADSLTAMNEEISTFTYLLTGEQRNVLFEKFGDIEFDSVSSHYFIPQNLILPYRNNSLTFNFGVVETGKPQLVRYQYMLEGYDSDWNPVTDQTTATFGNIYEGAYTFKLKAQGPNGLWGQPVTYEFKVLPPWYRTWWMYVLYSSFLISSVVVLVRLNNRRLRLKAAELVKEVQKATAEILNQKKVVEEQKLIVEEKNKDMRDSILYAKRIQDALLSDEEHVSLHLPDHFILYLPKDIVSGDFYWTIEKKYSNTDSEKIEHYWYVAVVDCTGHGVPGAFMSMLGMVFLNEIISDNKVHTPAAILNELRDRVVKQLGQTGKRDDTQDGMDISLMRLNLETNEVQWAGANNSLHLVCNGELSEIKADKQPIGYYTAPKPFTNHSIQLKKGDYIYIFSDGYADQFGGPKGKKFKYKQLEQLLVENSNLPMYQQKIALKKVFNEWRGMLEQVDDVCIIGIKI